jgi:hypothetical protein
MFIVAREYKLIMTFARIVRGLDGHISNSFVSYKRIVTSIIFSNGFFPFVF